MKKIHSYTYFIQFLNDAFVYIRILTYYGNSFSVATDDIIIGNQLFVLIQTDIDSSIAT